jgi:nicotinamide riboside kinase
VTVKLPKKFGIIGTSSSGKTTLTYEVCAYLKKNKVRVDGVLQQDRRFTFPRERLDTHIEAQYAVIFNMMAKESEMQLHEGVDCIVSDRSALDFYAYLEYQYGRIEPVWNMVKYWCSTYEKLFYLPPLSQYDSDGTRPAEEFAKGVDTVLRHLILNDIEVLPNLVLVEDRSSVAVEITKILQTKVRSR